MHKIWIVACAAAVLASSQASAINTRKDWDGTSNVGSFGCTNFTTDFGQVITLPKWKKKIGTVSIFVSASVSGSMVIRGEIYQWDPVNLRATGSAVYESAPRTITYTDTNYHRIAFDAEVSANPGQYIMFTTTDRDFDKCVNSFRLNWATVPLGTYKGGHFYYLHADGDPSLWTTTTWNGYISDAAFKATLLKAP